MIEAVEFENLKALRQVRIDLGRMTLLVGANGSGKTSVLQGIHRLMQLPARNPSEKTGPHGRPGAIFGGPSGVRPLFGGTPEQGFSIQGRFDDGSILGVSARADTEWEVRFDCWFQGDGNSGRVVFPPTNNNNLHALLEPLRTKRTSSIVLLRLDASELAKEHYSETAEPRLEYNGEGLASTLQYLQGLRDGTLEAIEQSLARVVPRAKRIRALPTKVRRRERKRVTVEGQDFVTEQEHDRTGARFEIEVDGQGWVRADQLSEGTLLTLGLLVVLHHRAPNTVLLDDVDKGLHPGAQKALMTVLREILEMRPLLQIVGSTHSPFVVDCVEPESVQVLAISGDGSTKADSLTNHPAWPRQKNFLSTGEFWSGVAEAWVTELRAG